MGHMGGMKTLLYKAVEAAHPIPSDWYHICHSLVFSRTSGHRLLCLVEHIRIYAAFLPNRYSRRQWYLSCTVGSQSTFWKSEQKLLPI